METAQVLRIFILTALGFVVGLLSTPIMTSLLYKFKFGKSIRSSDAAPIMSAIHKKKSGTPTMGGVLIWFTVLVLAVVLGLIAQVWPDSAFARLSFLSRAETLLPLGLMVMGAVVGMFDDVMNILKLGPRGGGLSVRQRLWVYTVLSAIGAWWFYSKLGFTSVHIPFVGDYFIGIWYIPFFILVMAATTHALNITDGLDGLAVGLITIALASFWVLASFTGQVDTILFIAVMVGSLLAFLYFNIFPARVWLGDTGALALGAMVGVVALLLDASLILPFIGLVFVIEAASSLLQWISKAVRNGKKIFIVAPIHHHFEAKGWDETKVTMRFWLAGAISAFVGLFIAFFGS